MSVTETLFSLPGEWIDSSGRASLRFPVHRIIVLKPDHIGDLLIAARGFELLRHFFPDAEIDLICGPWNVGLARKLGFFDQVYGVNLFHEISGEQSEQSVAIAARRKGIEQLAELHLGPYDLAIDFRYDFDSRNALLSINARARAGYGSVKEFPFIDIALPMRSGTDRPHNEIHAVMTGRNFHAAADVIDPRVLRDHGSGLIDFERRSVDLDLVVTGFKSPAECQTSAGDFRPLGVGLEYISIESIPDEGSQEQPWSIQMLPWNPSITLVSGWSNLENWGVWGVGGLCKIRIVLPPSRGEGRLRIGCSMRAHVNAANPEIDCVMRLSGTESEELVRFQNPQNYGSGWLSVDRHGKHVRLASEPIRLAPGVYDGLLRIFLPQAIRRGAQLRLTVRALESNARLAVRAFNESVLKKGLRDLAFACTVQTGDEPLSVELDVEDSSGLAGARIELLTFSLRQSLKLNTPPAHMDELARMLALRVAMEFSPLFPLVQSSVIQERLGAPGGAVPEALEELLRRIEGWKGEGCCVVGMALGCNSEIRKWPYQYFVELARQLLELEVKLIFVGSRGELAEAVDACRQLGIDPDRHAACGRVGLEDLGSADAGV